MKVHIKTKHFESVSCNLQSMHVNPGRFYVTYADTLLAGPFWTKQRANDQAMSYVTASGLDPTHLKIHTGAELVALYPEQCMDARAFLKLAE